MKNVDNVEPEENTSKKKRRVRRVRKKRVKKIRDDGEQEPDSEDREALREFQQGARFAKRKSSSLSLEVEKMAQGKPLTHFQAMAMLRKALIASFIAKPKNPGAGEVEMKNTECRRPSQDKTIPVESVQCLVLKDEEDSKKKEEQEEEVDKPSGPMKLVNKVAGKKSKWKIVEKEFVQGKDVSQNDAWKLILLSDFFPKGTTTFADIVNDDDDDDDDESSSDEEDEEEEEEIEIEDDEEEAQDV